MWVYWLTGGQHKVALRFRKEELEMADLTVKDIIKDYLVANGYDGLYTDDCGCCCERENLMPCYDGDYMLNCKPGYKCTCNKPEDSDSPHRWHIVSDKPVGKCC